MKSRNAEEQEEQNSGFERTPTYIKFFNKVEDYMWADKTWPPKQLIPDKVNNVYAYAFCMWSAKDALIESIVEKEPDFLSKKEIQDLKEDGLWIFESDLVTCLFSPILDRLGKPLRPLKNPQ